ncbi:MAG: benzoyl-CoA 2,3-epoxidase subunit BoxA [Rhodocyclaceae bacterium]|nr:benzoyl-CoA 2,3-epoxidase subunit BoxA [Rhodocyclaceae bacterium]MBK6552536.1 benzoyl-CoA 2,3-epoxidase subunit BoxA [Rhodocyclaceae bacterium]MBK9312073.1 benzoyl-CoA 2,3-epoxidase subunit BoxA [Rhodocyclaceae bacterium]
MTTETAELVRQHLIDPEICIRCNTCQEMCPIDAIEHDANNYVVKFDVCNWCNDCIGPCPTGAIDNYRNVTRDRPYSLDEQYGWGALPVQVEIAPGGGTEADLPPDVARMTSIATAGQGGPGSPPWSAAHPYVNLFAPSRPATATITGNYRLTGADASADIRHIVLDFGQTTFPVLEGQSIGILPPGNDENGKPHAMRLYSVASPRNGERPGYNNLALTVKRVTEDYDGQPVVGVCSNYLCDLDKGARVQVCGPYGTSFLMPNHPNSSIMMICTGTGSAPMRAMTERRRRRIALNEGGELMLFFGARTPDELPYCGPLGRLPKELIDVNFAFSRVPGSAKQYVQDKIRERQEEVFRLLRDGNCYIYICGLKGMENGVIEAFRDICRLHGGDWEKLKPELLAQARLHIETY